MLPSDVGPLQIDLVGVHRAISVEGSPCGGELGATQQVNVLRRTAPKRLRFGSIDRLIFVGLFRGLSAARDALAIVQPSRSHLSLSQTSSG
jgi:hypothetical protein